VGQGLISCWKTMGVPDFLQIDNQLCFGESKRYSHSFGTVLRFCLFLGIEVVFIPKEEPRCNGVKVNE
jgi:putative transposase